MAKAASSRSFIVLKTGGPFSDAQPANNRTARQDRRALSVMTAKYRDGPASATGRRRARGCDRLCPAASVGPAIRSPTGLGAGSAGNFGCNLHCPGIELALEDADPVADGDRVLIVLLLHQRQRLGAAVGPVDDLDAFLGIQGLLRQGAGHSADHGAGDGTDGGVLAHPVA